MNIFPTNQIPVSEPQDTEEFANRVILTELCHFTVGLSYTPEGADLTSDKLLDYTCTGIGRMIADGGTSQQINGVLDGETVSIYLDSGQFGAIPSIKILEHTAEETQD